MNPITETYVVEMCVGEVRSWTRMGRDFKKPEEALGWAQGMLTRHTEYQGYRVYRVASQAFLEVTWNRPL